MHQKNKSLSNTSLVSKIALLSACIFWASSFIAAKKALVTIPPLTVVTLRLIISSICFLAWLLLIKKPCIFPGNISLLKLFLLALSGTTLHYGIQTIGLQYTTASNASVYAATGPISIFIIAAIFLGEKITPKKIIGITAALLGVLMVMDMDTLSEFDLRGNVLGDSLVLLSVIMWGVFTVFGKDMMRKMEAVTFTALVTFIGTFCMIPIGLYEWLDAGCSFSSITIEAWISVCFLGITCSFLATLLYFYVLKQTSSQKVGIYLYTIPPITYIIAALYLKESIRLSLLIGTIIVLTGVYLTEKG